MIPKNLCCGFSSFLCPIFKNKFQLYGPLQSHNYIMRKFRLFFFLKKHLLLPFFLLSWNKIEISLFVFFFSLAKAIGDLMLFAFCPLADCWLNTVHHPFHHHIRNHLTFHSCTFLMGFFNRIWENLPRMETRHIPEEMFYSTKLAQFEHFPGKGSVIIFLIFFSKCYLFA